MPPNAGDTTLNQQKRSGSSMVQVVVLAVGQTLVPWSPDRTSLILCAHPTISYYVTANPLVSAAEGIKVSTGQASISLNLADHGSIIKGPFYVFTATLPMTVQYFESINTAG